MKPSGSWVKMDDIAHTQSNDGMLKNAALVQGVSADAGASLSNADAQERVGEVTEETSRRGWKGLGRKKRKQTYSHAHFKVYKRRWFGLAQLVLLNIVVSWDVGSLRFLVTTHNCSVTFLDMSRISYLVLVLSRCGNRES